MNKKLVSIIIPVYNIENYIERCLNSIIEQTYTNLEIILINDGSTDNSLTICKKYQKKDKRIKIISQKNAGVSSARNIGLKESNGNFITFIDADDYIEVDYINILVKKITMYDADIVFSNSINFDVNGNESIPVKIKKDYFFNSENIMIELLSEERISCSCWGKLYKKELISNIKFDEALKIGEDFKFLTEVLKKSNKNILISECKYHYYLRNNSAIRSGFNDNWISEINFCKSLIEKYDNQKTINYAIRRYIRVNTDIGYNFNLSKHQKKIIKDNMKPYLKFITFSKVIPIKKKIKSIIVYFFKL